MTTPDGGTRILVVARGGSSPPEREELRRLRDADAVPAVVDAEEDLGATALADANLAAMPGLRGRVLRRLPGPVALAVEVRRRRRDYDVVMSWSDGLAFPIAAGLALSRGRRAAHLGIVFWPFDASTPVRAKRLLKRVLFPTVARRGMERLLVSSPLQRRFVVERWGIPRERLVPAPLVVDTRFWRPMEAAGDLICSVGREMRDYATLIDALRPLDIPCHIAAGTSALNTAFGSEDPRAQNVAAQALPGTVTAGPKPPVELRELYARSRFVVVPILPSETDNGVTVILEAMAMGRAIVATATAGRPDELEDGVNCVLVPPQDPAALRTAIQALWDDPERCERLGAAGRARMEAENGVERWAATMRTVLAEMAPRP